MLDYVATLVSERALEVAEQEIQKCRMDHLDIDIDDSIRTKTKERAISQLTFKLTAFKVSPDATDEEAKDAFESWFKENEEAELRITCSHCLESELAKLKKEEDPNMSFLDRYLKEHKRH